MIDRSEPDGLWPRWLTALGGVFDGVFGVSLEIGAFVSIATDPLSLLHWLAAVPLGVFGGFILTKAGPRLRRSTAAETDVRYYLTAPERGEGRLRCPCCGSPSLDPGVPDQSCPACEWLVDGLPEELEAPPEELAAARESFRRFLSVYPPDARPEWSPDPPSADELELRRELLELYARALRDPQERSVWWEIDELERRIRELELEYSEEVEGRAGQELAAAEDEEEDYQEQPTLEPPAPRPGRGGD